MWEWREEHGRWRLDDSGSWNWDEPSLLERVGSAPFGAAGPRGRTAGRPASAGPPPVPATSPGPWAPPEPWSDGGLPAVTAEIPAEETPIFAAVAEDHERDEATGGQRLRPSRHGVPEDPAHPGAVDRREYRTAPWIPEPSPGSGPFPVPVARHARTDGRDRHDAVGALDGRHAVRR